VNGGKTACEHWVEIRALGRVRASEWTSLRTIDAVEVIVAAVLAGIVGLLAGMLLTRAGRRTSSSLFPVPARLFSVSASRIGVPDPTGRPLLSAAAPEALHIAAVVVDKQGAVVLANSAGRAMGLIRGDELALPELRNIARAARRSAAASETEVRLLHGWWPRDPAAVYARAVPIGHAGHVALLVEDVTEARRVADVRRDFVANVSHELKTPVGALSLLSEALQEASDDPSTVRRFADRMHHESTRLARLVSELIELSRLEAAEPVAEPAAVPVRDILAEAIDRTRLAADARHSTVVVDGATDASLVGNREQLVTALVNLLDNAIAYSPEHSDVNIAARLRRAADVGDIVELAVTDHGIGVAETDVERIFERFYRADPARSRATGGTGLGLAIVKHIAVNHGGRVEVSSRLGHGSTFTLCLPLNRLGPGNAGQPPTPIGVTR
jgi:two-component system sensor histidine kinase SenX3